MVRKTTLRKCFEVETTKNWLKKSKTLSSTKAIRSMVLGSPLIGYMTHKKAHLEFVCKTKPEVKIYDGDCDKHFALQTKSSITSYHILYHKSSSSQYTPVHSCSYLVRIVKLLSGDIEVA